MRKFLYITQGAALCAALLLVSCAAPANYSFDTHGAMKPAEPVTINGVWTLATINDGIPVSGTPISGSITVTDGTDYTSAITLPGMGTLTSSGTVALNTGSIYTFTDAGLATEDFTLSEDGTKISNADNAMLGPNTYTK